MDALLLRCLSLLSARTHKTNYACCLQPHCNNFTWHSHAFMTFIWQPQPTFHSMPDVNWKVTTVLAHVRFAHVLCSSGMVPGWSTRGKKQCSTWTAVVSERSQKKKGHEGHVHVWDWCWEVLFDLSSWRELKDVLLDHGGTKLSTELQRKCA